jgi:phosphohistidine phosphatase
MNIYILRHGQAAPQQTIDEARELTEKGRLDTARVISGRLADLQAVTQIWASPLVRAQQTAHIAARYLPTSNVMTSDLIVPEADPFSVMEWLQSCERINQSILLVSHQPLVGELVNKLCGKPAGFYSMGTSSLAAIYASVVATGMGELMWLDHP